MKHNAEPENRGGGKSALSRVLWAVYALVIVAAIVGVNWQNYRILTGQVESALPLQADSIKKFKTEIIERPAHGDHVDTPQANALFAAQEVAPDQLAGTKNRVTFRSQGANFICTIATDLSKDEPALVPLPAAATGGSATGPGAVCATVHPFRQLSGNIGKCEGAAPRVAGLGIWNDGSGAGLCVSGRAPLTDDAFNHQERTGEGERYAFPVLGISQSVFIGDYGCLMQSNGATCLNYKTGGGFTFSENEGYSYF